MVHLMTGNQLDVVMEVENGVQVLRGLKRHGSDEIIPLPEPDALVEVLKRVINECRASKFAADEKRNDD